MDIFKTLQEKYDIDYDHYFNRITIHKPINVKDFILLRNISESKHIKEIIVERKVSVYERSLNI